MLKKAVRNTQAQYEAVRSTLGGGGYILNNRVYNDRRFTALEALGVCANVASTVLLAIAQRCIIV